MSRENIYLVVSFFSAIVLPISLGTCDKDISFFVLNTNLFWMPFWLLILFLPFYGIIQIVKLTDEIPIKYWIALLINLVNFIFILRFFSIDIYLS